MWQTNHTFAHNSLVKKAGKFFQQLIIGSFKNYIKVLTCRLNQKSWFFLKQYADFNLVHENFGGWADLTICQSGAGP